MTKVSNRLIEERATKIPDQRYANQKREKAKSGKIVGYKAVEPMQYRSQYIDQDRQWYRKQKPPEEVTQQQFAETSCGHQWLVVGQS